MPLLYVELYVDEVRVQQPNVNNDLNVFYEGILSRHEVHDIESVACTEHMHMKT
jgi:hypothetical protein